jgi:hypothetical protein
MASEISELYRSNPTRVFFNGFMVSLKLLAMISSGAWRPWTLKDKISGFVEKRPIPWVYQILC